MGADRPLLNRYRCQRVRSAMDGARLSGLKLLDLAHDCGCRFTGIRSLDPA